MDNEIPNLNYDYAIHSDFLIHWTGKYGDIDTGLDWYTTHDKSKTTHEETNKYLERLHNILKYGFWMTHDTQSYPELELPTVPKVAQTCFTELRVSQARKHAKNYGRLGIGVKRYFLFSRGGRPVVYHNFGRKDKVKDPFYEACNKLDPHLLNYFKPMNSTNTLNYDLYAESEWRILCADSDLNAVKAKKPTAEAQYYQQLNESQQKILKYLLPIDDWLGLIIYPSLDVKKQTYTYENGAIRKLIEEIVNRQSVEKGIWPIEVSLDACRNF